MSAPLRLCLREFSPGGWRDSLPNGTHTPHPSTESGESFTRVPRERLHDGLRHPHVSSEQAALPGHISHYFKIIDVVVTSTFLMTEETTNQAGNVARAVLLNEG